MRTLDRTTGMLVLGVLAGCEGPKAAPPPWLSRQEVIQAVNDNNTVIDFGIKGKGLADVFLTERKTIPEGNGTPGKIQEIKHRELLKAIVLLVKPSHLYVQLDHSLGQTIMRMGTNGERFWLWTELEMDTLWWGRNENLDRPCLEAIPIRPDHLLEALGISDLPASASDGSGLAARVTADWNQLVFLRRTETHPWAIEREWWIQRRPPYRLREIVHRGPDGHETMHTTLSRYVAIAGTEEIEPAPVMARQIQMAWPEEKSSIRLSLDRWERIDALDASHSAFTFPGDNPDLTFNAIEQIDAECGP